MTVKSRFDFLGEYYEYMEVDNDLNGIPMLFFCTYSWPDGSTYLIRKISLKGGFVIKTINFSGIIGNATGALIAGPYMDLIYLNRSDLLLAIVLFLIVVGIIFIMKNMIFTLYNVVYSY